MLYSSGPVSVLDSVQTPLTMQTQDGRTFMVIHEANLVDYARMFLRGARSEGRVLTAALAPMADGIKVRGRTPFVTPWRTIQLADKATGLAPSLLGLNLNPPNALASTDWIHPMKYVGIWWGMHIGAMTWSSGPKHGATTANARRYIDFAAANGLGGVLVEGWNTGWDGDWIANREAFSFTQSYPDYDLRAVAAYARQKGVRLIVHNETSGGIQNYERQLDSAFALYRSLGLDALKTHRPAAAIIDLRLRRGSGREVVVSTPPGVPVIIFSGLRSESADLETIRPNTRLVEKPYSLVMLMDTLEDMLEQSRGNQSGFGRIAAS